MCMFPLIWVGTLYGDTIQSDQTQRFGLHGMLLFSDGNSLYASHLPMFHKPHDVQLILRFELKDSAKQKELVDALSIGNRYWTLAPEKFDLNLLAINSKDGIWYFKADLYKDHFERNGLLMFSEQTIVVKEVLLRNQLNPELPEQTIFNRLTPTDAKRQFFVRLIQGKPGIDQIFWMRSPTKLPNQFSLNTASHTLDLQSIASELGIKPKTINLYYEEQGDLR